MDINPINAEFVATSAGVDVRNLGVDDFRQIPAAWRGMMKRRHVPSKPA